MSTVGDGGMGKHVLAPVGTNEHEALWAGLRRKQLQLHTEALDAHTTILLS